MTEDPSAGDWRRRAFPAAADPRLFWSGGTHAVALASLRDLVLRGERVALVTGETGTGKSLLLNALADVLAGTDTLVGRLSYVGIEEPADLRAAIALAFRLDVADVVSREDLQERLVPVVSATQERGGRVALLIDEAQSLAPACHAEIAWLLGVLDGLTAILAGDEEPRDRLAAASELLALPPASVARLAPWNEGEVAAYIAYALTSAGADADPFGPGVVHEVWLASRGTPRLVNGLCREALRVSAAPDVEVIRRCSVAMNGPCPETTALPDVPALPSFALPLGPVEAVAPRRPRLTPARAAVTLLVGAAMAMSAVVVASSSSVHRSIVRGRERSAPAVAAANEATGVATVASPVITPPPVADPPDRDATVIPPDRVVAPALRPSRPSPPAVVASPRRPGSAPRASRRMVSAEKPAPDAEVSIRDSGAIIEWLLEEHARKTTGRSH